MSLFTCRPRTLAFFATLLVGTLLQPAHAEEMPVEADATVATEASQTDVGPEPEPAVAATTPPPPPRPFLDTYWKLVELDGRAVVPERGKREAHLIFEASGRVVGVGGCNRFFGQYERSEDLILFSHIGTMMMACLAGEHEEQTLLNGLNRVDRWRFSDGQLLLSLPDGRVFARFVGESLH